IINRPRSSNSLAGFAPGLALRIAVSVKGIWGNSFLSCGVTPKSYPCLKLDAIGRCYPMLDDKGKKKPALRRV
ncbi:MAG: hypothetical protein WAT12_02240, partial [Candidatus Nitrotoga sp.]